VSFRALEVAPPSGCGISEILPAVTGLTLPIEAGGPESDAGCELVDVTEEDGARAVDGVSTVSAGAPHSSRTEGSKAAEGLNSAAWLGIVEVG
jgi:hypothetical protein